VAGPLIGGLEMAERMLAGVLDRDKVKMIMDDLRGPAGRTLWDKLGGISEDALAAYLRHEYPQTVALVLGKIRPEHAARVLARLPEELAIEVVMRMLRMEAVQREVLEDVEKTLRADFMNNLARGHGRDSHEAMAEIFNHLDRGTEARFLNLLEERNREAVDRIRALMFTFEDLSRLSPAGIQTLLRYIPQDRLVVALKGASESLRELFFGNVSERAAKILKEDLAALGPVRVRDVEEAQAEMVATAKRLAADGELVLAQGKDEELVD
jgi:flagellar motor switch protein FliG